MFVKNKKSGKYRPLWYVLSGKELYEYRKRYDKQYRSLLSLVGTYVKEEADEALGNGHFLYGLRVLQPNSMGKVYFLQNKNERD